MRRTNALILLTLAALATNAFAVGEARITGKVIDGAPKQPIPDATINVTAISGHNFKEDFKVDKNGSYAIFLVDGTLKYKITFAATRDGSYVEDMELELGEPDTKDITLNKTAAATGAVQGQA